MTPTLRVIPASTWLANRTDADTWVANWGGWLASLGYLPMVRHVTVTIDTPSDDPSIGDARQILNGDSVEVGAGDHATVTCDDSTGCSTT